MRGRQFHQRSLRSLLIAPMFVALVAGGTLLAERRPDASARVSIASILKPGLPLELVSAKKADRIAWISYEEGQRNVFTAAAPGLQGRARDVLSQGRRRRPDGAEDIRRRQHAGVRARACGEQRRMGRESRRRSERHGARHLGRESRHARPGEAPRRRTEPRSRAGWIVRALHEGRPDLSRARRHGGHDCRSIAAKRRSSRRGAATARRGSRRTAATLRSPAIAPRTASSVCTISRRTK